jgi:ribonuclease HII
MVEVPDFNFEQSFLPSGCRYILGLDEVGRGPWAGPVTVGAFLLDLSTFDVNVFKNLKIRDSKLLSSSQRLHIFNYFQEQGYTASTFSASSEDIDQYGIALTLKLLFRQALKSFGNRFDIALIDGSPVDLSSIKAMSFSERNHPSGYNEGVSTEKTLLPDADDCKQSALSKSSTFTNKCKFIVKGDRRCFSIAAASIVAKVTRDHDLDLLDASYPQYGFKDNKGYGTKSHQAALNLHGPCPAHRRSYRPIKTLLSSGVKTRL